jgi:D-alanyl-D-alanine dipeptidase
MATESEVAQSAEALRAAQQSLAQTTSDLANKQSALASATSATYSALKGFGNSMASGRAEIQSLNQMYELMAQAVGKTSRIFGELGSKIPVFGGFFSALGQLGATSAQKAGQSLQFLNVQIQSTLKQFQSFGSIGALGAEGMSGLRDQMKASGMTMEGFQQTVMANSEALAAFAGTTSEGAQKFSEIVGAITTTGLGDQLRNIGMSADQIGEAAAAFAAREQRLGRGQALRDQDAARTAQTAAAYAKELDTLARLTGQSVDAIRRQQDAALSESRFRASLYELDDKAQERLLAGQNMFARAPQIAQGIRDLVSGVPNTDAALKLVALTGGEAASAVERLKNGQINEFQFREEMNVMLRKNAKAFADNAKYADGASEAFGDFAQFNDIINQNVQGTESAIKAQAGLASGQDALTASTVAAQKALENLSRVVLNIVNAMMPYAARLNAMATGTLVEGFNLAAPFLGTPSLNTQTGEGLVRPTGYGANAPPNIQQNAAALGAIMGNRPQLNLGQPSATSSEASPRNLLDFEGSSLQSFQQMDSNVQAAILRAAQDFYRDTGQRLRIGSSFRTREQQQALWDRRANNPYPVAPPGSSRHEHGLAVDIMNYQAAERYLNQQGLYRPDPRGDRIHFEPGGGDANGITTGRGGYTPTLDNTFNMPVGNNANNQTSAADMTVLQEQLARLDRIVSATERQAQLSQQYLQYAS